jgi:hypothetical protein
MGLLSRKAQSRRNRGSMPRWHDAHSSAGLPGCATRRAHLAEVIMYPALPIQQLAGEAGAASCPRGRDPGSSIEPGITWYDVLGALPAEARKIKQKYDAKAEPVPSPLLSPAIAGRQQHMECSRTNNPAVAPTRDGSRVNAHGSPPAAHSSPASNTRQSSHYRSGESSDAECRA